MDSRMIKSAGIAALLVAVIYILVTVVPTLLFYGDPTPYSSFLMVYMLLSLIFPVVCYALLGFLAVYIFKRHQGRLTPTNCVILTTLTVIFYAIVRSIVTAIFSAISYLHFMREYMPDGSEFMLIYAIILSIIMQIFIAFFGMIPALVGAVTGFAVFASDVERKSWKVNAWVIVAAVTFTCVVLIIGFVILWQLWPTPPSSGVNRCVGFEMLKCFDSTIQYTSGAAASNLTATFTNAGGQSVVIRRVWTEPPSDCSFAEPSGVDTHLLDGGAAATDVRVSAGDTFQFVCDTTGEIAVKAAGETFNVDIHIEYTEEVAGRTLTHTDVGRITGYAE